MKSYWTIVVIKTDLSSTVQVYKSRNCVYLISWHIFKISKLYLKLPKPWKYLANSALSIILFELLDFLNKLKIVDNKHEKKVTRLGWVMEVHFLSIKCCHSKIGGGHFISGCTFLELQWSHLSQNLIFWW